ncbi:peroxiredoxin [Actinomycetospora lutea]|uniref:peroxiredoxin n=1 Tax=Actinomycetospora lutea TaxID=663604 RepID=UPI00236681CB|nr:peroxiredoxin [Actinomycetospora lutea]MDD7939806.1 peroxiredoxin [Actinomycetospora lutea]
MIAVGEKIPDVPLTTVDAEGNTESVRSGELFATGRTVLFGVPAAFSPTCSDAHLPGFVAKAGEISAKGVDRIVCVSVNDPFVMGAWAKDQAVEGVVMLADGSALFARAMGLDLDGTDFGLGVRSQRYASIIDDGTLTWIDVEAAPPDHEKSTAEVVLTHL